MTPCTLDPKNTYYFDIRNYPDFKKKWEEWFSSKVITSKGYRSSYWNTKKTYNFGNASTSIMNLLVHDDLFFNFKEERQNMVEMNKANSVDVVYMPQSIGEVKEKILCNTILFNAVLGFASEVQSIIKQEKEKIKYPALNQMKSKNKNTKKLF